MVYSQPFRIRNGDETDWGGPGFDETPAVLQVTLSAKMKEVVINYH